MVFMHPQSLSYVGGGATQVSHNANCAACRMALTFWFGEVTADRWLEWCVAAGNLQVAVYE